MTLNKDLVAATAEPLILSILSRKESYGYALIKEVQVLSMGNLNWTEGMLYPVLHRLEKRGVIESLWRDSETGRKRKYYKIKREGLAQLTALLKQWETAHEALLASRGGINV